IPSTSNSISKDFASSTVITPSLPTFFIASARNLPISASPLAEIVPTWAISSLEVGAQMVREVASKSSDFAGDGTTTATVLAQAIVKEGSKAVAAGMNPMDLKRGIDLAVEAVVEDLKKNSKKVRQIGTLRAITRQRRPRHAPYSTISGT